MTWERIWFREDCNNRLTEQVACWHTVEFQAWNMNRCSMLQLNNHCFDQQSRLPGVRQKADES